MSKTFANLLGMVAGMAIMFGTLWICVRLGMLREVPTDWVWSFLVVTALIEAGIFLWRLRRRRSSGH